MNRIADIKTTGDIFPEYRHTPIALLLEYHNLNRPIDPYSQAQLLIGTCMDNRIHLRLPDNFAFIIRAGGANLRYSEFTVSYAVAVGNIQHIAIIAHSKCGMVNLSSRKSQFVNGLVDKADWDKEWAEEHFMHLAPMFEIGNEIDFVLSEAKRLRVRYPNITVAPLFYRVEDNRLYLLKENE
ncbi:MAG: carbonic anhydrase [Bacteroidales bacterium]